MNEVAKQSTQVEAMETDWHLVESLAGGTKAMRAAKKTYLPQRPLETDLEYQNRLKVATLFPAFSTTIDSMVGRVFAEPLQYGDDIPQWIVQEVLDNIDLQGRNLHVFARDWFNESLTYGLSHCLIESPITEGITNQAQQKQSGVRPYAIQINPRRIIGWREQNGVLTQLRVAFTRTENDGDFATKEVKQIRVYKLVEVGGKVSAVVETHEENAKNEWVLIGEPIKIGLSVIPLVTLYTGRRGFMMANPPLRELGYLNVKHWWLQSGNDSIVDVVQVAILAMIGVNSGDKVEIGAKHGIQLPSGADMKYIEHSGQGVKTGFEALERIKDEMRQSGARLLIPQSGTKTATQASEDSNRENSALGAMVQTLEDTLDQLLYVIGAYRGETSGGSIEVQANLDSDTAPTETMGVLRDMHNAGALSKQTWFDSAQRLELIPDEIEWEDEQVRIQEENGVPPPPNNPPQNEIQQDNQNDDRTIPDTSIAA